MIKLYIIFYSLKGLTKKERIEGKLAELQGEETHQVYFFQNVSIIVHTFYIYLLTKAQIDPLIL